MIPNNRLGLASGKVGIEDNVCPGKRAGHGAVSPRRFGLIMELCVFDPRHISFGVEFNGVIRKPSLDLSICVRAVVWIRFAVKPARSNLAANAMEKQPA
jgi:hypothetical protein